MSMTVLVPVLMLRQILASFYLKCHCCLFVKATDLSLFHLID